MAYITPIFDRTAADVHPGTETAKGYWNVSDWERIYNNTKLARNLAQLVLGLPVPFTFLATPTLTTIPTVTEFNQFLGNIETLRSMIVDESTPQISIEIKDNYMAGVGQSTFNYVDVNLWERTIDEIWNILGGDVLEVCPTLEADLIIPTDTTVIYIDCVDPGEFEIIIEGTGVLHIL